MTSRHPPRHTPSSHTSLVRGPGGLTGPVIERWNHQAMDTVSRPLLVTNFRCGTESLLTCEVLTSFARVAKPVARLNHLLLAAPRRRLTPCPVCHK